MTDRVSERELEPIKAKARDAWLRQVRRTAVRRRAAHAGLAIAAAIVLAIGVAVLRPNAAPRLSQPAATLEAVVGEATIGPWQASEAAGRPVASGTTITTGDSGRTALRLAAGHSVRVDVGSSVRIVSGRSLSLERGALYVDSEALGPVVTGLEIDTPLGRVSDIGTQFEVRLLAAQDLDANTGALRVRVREGAVRLTTGSVSYEAPAGSELYLRAGGHLDRAAAAPYGAQWEWVESVRPRLSIEGLRLDAFLDWASRESGRPWRFAQPGRGDAGSVILHGSIDGLTVEEALSTVLPSCGFDHRVADDELLIESDEG